MDNVFHQIVFSRGDENLVPGDCIGAVIVFHSRGGDSSQVGTGFGFGKQHGPAPFSRKHIFKIDIFLFVRSECMDQVAGAQGQAGIHHESIVGSVEIITGGKRNGFWHSLSTPFGIFAHGNPLAVYNLFICLVKGFRYCDFTVFQLAANLVPFFLGRKNLLDGKVPRFGDDHIHRFFVEFPEFFMFAEFIDVQLFMKNKIHIPTIRNLLCHFPFLPFSSFKICAERSVPA